MALAKGNSDAVIGKKVFNVKPLLSMTHAYIGLGSNLNDPITQISAAIASLEELPDTILLHSSSFYRSKPVGSQDQPDFINAVVMLNTELSALKLLDHLQFIEEKRGRVRGQERWGPRTLDLDLLLYGNEQIDQERLTVPHKELHNRRFVLYPLNEIASELIIPGYGSVNELLQKIKTDDIYKLD